MSECLRRELVPFGIDVVIVGAPHCMTDSAEPLGATNSPALDTEWLQWVVSPKSIVN